VSRFLASARSERDAHPHAAQPHRWVRTVGRIHPPQVGAEAQPGRGHEGVVGLDALLVLEAADRRDGVLQFVADILEEVADAEPVERSPGHDRMAGESPDE